MKKQSPPSDTGIYFHTFDSDAGMIWQGVVLRELPLGHLEILLFSWGDGSENGTKIVNGAHYEWAFYTSHDKFLAAGDKYNKSTRFSL